MKMVLEVGRLCVKTAGRDAMEYCVIVEILDDTYVLVDGNTRRKKVNKAHIEPTSKKIDIKKGADTKTVQTALEKENISIKVKGKARKAAKPQETKSRDKPKTDKKASKKK